MAKAQILVVEDERIVAKDVQNILERMGYAVPAVVSSGEEAIQKAEETHPDLVLMDILLRGNVDGIEAAEQIRERFHTPVIYLTAYGDDETLQRAKITEPYGYILKPFQERELYTIIEMALYKHQMERKLKKTTALLQNILESSSSISIISTDLDRNILYWNAGAENIFGYNAEEVVGLQKDDILYLDEEEMKKNIDMVRSAILNGGKKAASCEIKEKTKDGRELWIRLAVTPILDENSQIIGILGIGEDITERRRMEEELLKIQKLESIGVLAGGIAHDFNNILTGILGNISLARIYKDPLKVYERLAEAEKACMQARDLTQQLLTFSRGGAPIKKKASIAELLKESAIFALRGSDVRCEFSITDDLWTAEVDESQISQVINNIIINADQAMPGGGVIKVRTENVVLCSEDALPLKAGEYIKVSIADQGIGIPEEYLQKIFDPYFTTKQKGSGLGLATSYSIIKKHGGHIMVESRAGFGSTFHFYLPASPGRAPTKEQEKEELFTGRGRVLVMDDEEFIRELASEILTNIGYEVTLVADGAEAITRYKEAKKSAQPFSCVIMDLTVPGGMGGKEAIRKLVKIDPAVKVIVSSGYSNDPIMADFREYGFRGVIAKPYKTRELSQVLHKVIKG